MGAVPRSRGQPQRPSERVPLGLSRLPAGRGGLQPDACGTGLVGRTLAGRADDCLSGALPGLPARAAGGAGGGAMPAVLGLRHAQPAAVAEPGAAGVGAPTADMNEPVRAPRPAAGSQREPVAACLAEREISAEPPDSRRKPHVSRGYPLEHPLERSPP